MALDPSSILLTDRVAVVTGGGAGIGRGIAAGLQGIRRAGGDLGTQPRIVRVRRRGDRRAGHHRRRPRQRRGRRRTRADRRRTRSGDDPGQQRRRRLLVGDPRHHRERLGRAVQVQSAPRLPVHPAGGPRPRRAEVARQHHQRHLDRRCPRRTGLRDLRGGQGRRHQLHQDRGPRTRPARHPGQRAGPRHHPDRRHHANRPAGLRRAVRLARFRWAARATSTRWQAPQCFSRPTCPATSPGRRSTSTAAPRPPAAGTTIRRPAPTCSGRASGDRKRGASAGRSGSTPSARERSSRRCPA